MSHNSLLSIAECLRRLCDHDEGGDIAEYALLATLILLMVASAALAIGINGRNALNGVLSGIAGQLRSH
jgi:Flp pilus assembly pilin Flp